MSDFTRQEMAVCSVLAFFGGIILAVRHDYEGAQFSILCAILFAVWGKR